METTNLIGQNRTSAKIEELKVASQTNPKDFIKLQKISNDIIRGDVLLGKSVLEYFNGEEIFIYSNNKFYTVENTENNPEGYSLRYNNRKFGILESENLFSIESDFIDKNKDNIRNFQQGIIKNISSQNESLKEKLSSIKIGNDNDFSLDEYISDYIFARYHGRKMKTQKQEINLRIPEFNKNIQLRDIVLSGLKNSMLEKLVEETEKDKKTSYGGLIFIRGNVYSFSPFKDKRDRELDFGKVSYLTSLEKFCIAYKKKINEEIKKRVKNNFESEISKILAGQESLQKVSSIKRTITNRDGEIGFNKISENQVYIYLSLPDFIMEKEGHYALFKNLKFGTDIIKSKGNIEFIIPARAESRYGHPFIWEETGEICYHRTPHEISELLNIKSSNYNLSKFNEAEKTAFARDIVRLLELTRQIFRVGYTEGQGLANGSAFSEKEISQLQSESLKRRGVKVYNNG